MSSSNQSMGGVTSRDEIGTLPLLGHGGGSGLPASTRDVARQLSLHACPNVPKLAAYNAALAEAKAGDCRRKALIRLAELPAQVRT